MVWCLLACNAIWNVNPYGSSFLCILLFLSSLSRWPTHCLALISLPSTKLELSILNSNSFDLTWSCNLKWLDFDKIRNWGGTFGGYLNCVTFSFFLFLTTHHSDVNAVNCYLANIGRGCPSVKYCSSSQCSFPGVTLTLLWFSCSSWYTVMLPVFRCLPGHQRIRYQGNNMVAGKHYLCLSFRGLLADVA